MAKKRILVVDYEPKSLERLLELVPSDKYEIATARDGMVKPLLMSPVCESAME